MAKQIRGDRHLTSKEVDRLKASFQLDLIAYYKALQADVAGAIERGARDGKTPDEIISDVEGLFENGISF